MLPMMCEVVREQEAYQASCDGICFDEGGECKWFSRCQMVNAFIHDVDGSYMVDDVIGVGYVAKEDE